MECIYINITITKADQVDFLLANITNIVNVDDFIYIQLLKRICTIVSNKRQFRNMAEMEPK